MSGRKVGEWDINYLSVIDKYIVQLGFDLEFLCRKLLMLPIVDCFEHSNGDML